MTNQAIPTESVKERLRDLFRAYLPSADRTVCLFAEYLAERLGHEVTPRGLRATADIALQDLQNKNDRTDEFSGGIPLHYADLTGRTFRYYGLLGGYIPEIARAICPTDFADRVERLYQEAKKK